MTQTRSDYAPHTGTLITTGETVTWFGVQPPQEDYHYDLDDIAGWLVERGFDAKAMLFDEGIEFRENATQQYANIPNGWYGALINGVVVWMDPEMFERTITPISRRDAIGLIPIIPVKPMHAIKITKENMREVYAWLKESDEDVALNPSSIDIYNGNTRVVGQLWAGNWLVLDHGLKICNSDAHLAQHYRKV